MTNASNYLSAPATPVRGCDHCGLCSGSGRGCGTCGGTPPERQHDRRRVCVPCRRGGGRVQAGSARREGRPLGLAGDRLPALDAGALRVAVRRAGRDDQHHRGRDLGAGADAADVVQRGRRAACRRSCPRCPASCSGWHHLQPQEFGRLSLLVFLGGVAYISTNVLTVAGVVAIYQGVSLRSVIDDYVRHSGPAFGIMAFIAALATTLWLVNPLFELLLAGPLFALALYQRYAYRTVVATRDAETDAPHRPAQPPVVPDRPPRVAGAVALDELAALAGADRHRRLQEHQRPLRPPGGRPGADPARRASSATSTASTRPTGSAARSSQCC